VKKSTTGTVEVLVLLFTDLVLIVRMKKADSFVLLKNPMPYESIVILDKPDSEGQKGCQIIHLQHEIHLLLASTVYDKNAWLQDAEALRVKFCSLFYEFELNRGHRFEEDALNDTKENSFSNDPEYTGSALRVGSQKSDKGKYFKDLTRSKSAHDTLSTKPISRSNTVSSSYHARESNMSSDHEIPLSVGQASNSSYKDEEVNWLNASGASLNLSAGGDSLKKRQMSNSSFSEMPKSTTSSLAKNTNGFLNKLSSARTLLTRTRKSSENSNTSSTPSLSPATPTGSMQQISSGITAGGSSWGTKIMRKTSRMSKLKGSAQGNSSSTTALEFLQDESDPQSPPDFDNAFGMPKSPSHKTKSEDNSAYDIPPAVDSDLKRRTGASINSMSLMSSNGQESESMTPMDGSFSHDEHAKSLPHQNVLLETEEEDWSKEEDGSLHESLLSMERESVSSQKKGEAEQQSMERTRNYLVDEVNEEEDSDDDITALRKLSAALLAGDGSLVLEMTRSP
jgi:hypothetical protein